MKITKRITAIAAVVYGSSALMAQTPNPVTTISPGTTNATYFSKYTGPFSIEKSIYLNESASGNIGIGITNATNRLHINSTGTNHFRLSFLPTFYTDFYPTVNGNLIITPMSNGVPGKVGIGVNPPTQTLDVQGNASLRGGHIVLNSADGIIDWGGAGTGNLYFRTLNTQGDITAYNDRVAILNNGNVGIGTTSPAAKLSIANGANDLSNYGKAFQITNASGASQQMAFVRQGFDAVSAGFYGANSVWGFGTGQQTDVNFIPNYLALDLTNQRIGIGTTAPTSHFEVASSLLGSTAGNQVAWAKFSGQVGSGNNDQLKIYSQRIAGGGANWNSSEIKIQRAVDAVNMSFISFRSTHPTWGNSAIVFGSDNTDHMMISNDGKVSIGTLKMTGTHSDAKLSVDGKMVAKEIIVTTSNWADYVFAKDYKLPNLYEVEKYYLANKHLPEIPSEKEVIDNGIDVAEMNKLLLKKVEEMTIMMVQQQKDIDAMKKKLEITK